jgi:thiamine pyrophosphate-dependent acetolactate synthase large subunit-like protein
LHAVARTLNSGVLNTWGAKGVFHWRSRHHWATAGLQRDDFRLAGIGEADLILVVGVDDREAPRDVWAERPHVVLPPEALDPLAELVEPKRVDLDLPPLRSRLASVTQAGWQSTRTPLAPSQVTLHYGQHLAGGGLVAADAGMSGFWVARTFATTELGMVAVPAELDPGWAVACVVVARLVSPLRPALAVVDDPIDEVTASVLEFASGRGISVGLEAWSPTGEPIAAESHQRRVAELVASIDGPPRIATLSTDESQLEQFVAVAGPVREWKPRPPHEA